MCNFFNKESLSNNIETNTIICNKNNVLITYLISFISIIIFSIKLVIYTEKKYVKNKLNYINNNNDFVKKIEEYFMKKENIKSIKNDWQNIKILIKEYNNFVEKNKEEYYNIEKLIKEEKVTTTKKYENYLLNNQYKTYEKEINYKLCELYKKIYINKNNKWTFGYYEFIEKLNNQINENKWHLYDLNIEKENLKNLIKN